MLTDAIKRHIELYRSMGYKYRVQAYMLESFAAFAEGRSEQFIRAETVLDGATGAPSIRQRYDRLLTVRHLACALMQKTNATKCHRPMPSGTRQGGGGLVISTLTRKSVVSCEPLHSSRHGDRSSQSRSHP